jgi:hypothetical protein
MSDSSDSDSSDSDYEVPVRKPMKKLPQKKKEPVMYRVCGKCKIIKTIPDFPVGRYSCKDCMRDYWQQYRVRERKAKSQS